MSDVNIVIFSKNRAMQLDLCLNTLYKNTLDEQVPPIFVIYKADKQHEKSYEILSKEHPYVNMVREKDFKNDLLKTVIHERYVLFATDDSVFINQFRFSNLINTLEVMQSALGISLRLGHNTQWCYPLEAQQQLPKKEWKLNYGLSFYQWAVADKDFNYPIELSSSLYRVDDIYPILEHTDYKNPNDLEAMMNMNAQVYANIRPFLIYNYISLAFANPINRVQTVALANKYGNKPEYTSESLLTKYMYGARIDQNKFEKYLPSGCHQEVEFLYRKK